MAEGNVRDEGMYVNSETSVTVKPQGNLTVKPRMYISYPNP